jgi:hypothetical protein
MSDDEKESSETLLFRLPMSIGVEVGSSRDIQQGSDLDPKAKERHFER